MSERKRVFALETGLSLIESNDDTLEDKTKEVLRYSICRRGTQCQENKPMNEILIAVAPVMKENDLETFERSMDALKKAWCCEFDELSRTMRRRLFSDAPEENKKYHMDLYHPSHKSTAFVAPEKEEIK